MNTVLPTDPRATHLLEHFDLLLTTPADAEHLEIMLFDLAVEGELVPHDPNDESATELFERIKAERIQSPKKKRSREVEFRPIEPEEMPYEVPEGWKWVRLPEIGEINPRNEAIDNAEASFVPMTLVSTKYGEPHTSEKRLWKEIKSGYTHFRENDVVAAKITPCFQNRKSVVMKDLANGIGAGTTELFVFRGNQEHILPEYVLVFFKTSRFIEGGRVKMTGTAGQQRVPKDYVTQIPFPLPPLAEQKRIVAAVDALLAQTRALAARLEQADAALIPAAQAAFRALPDAPDATAQRAVWQRVADHFDALTNDLRTIAALKRTILQLAVEGKLVPQNPEDEPASVLLERIEAVKARLVQEKKIAASKLLPPIESDEIPYQLPNDWVWRRLNEITISIETGPFGSHLHQSDYVENGIPVINPASIKDGEIVPLENMAINEETRERLSRHILRNGDIIMARRGEMGRCALVTPKEEGWLCGTGSLVIKFTDDIYRKFIVQLLGSQHVREYLQGSSVGTTMSNLNQRILKNLVIGVPPLAEQKRIVAKVEALLGLCDALAAGVVQAEAVRVRVLGAVLKGEYHG